MALCQSTKKAGPVVTTPGGGIDALKVLFPLHTFVEHHYCITHVIGLAIAILIKFSYSDIVAVRPPWKGMERTVIFMARTRKPVVIPPGYSLEELTALAEQHLRQQRNEYNRTHPEVVERQRCRTYRNYLQRHGMVVIEALPPQPWDTATEKNILQSLREGLRNE